MVVYHGAWFATDAGVLSLSIPGGWGWRVFQKSIAGTFFLLVGVSLHLSTSRTSDWRPFFMRLAKVLGCAAVVTTTSLVLDPRRAVTFGILHAIAACTLAARPLVHQPSWLVGGLAFAAIAAGMGPARAFLDHPAWVWTGLSPVHLPTFDHQPFFPWWGVVLLGLLAGRWLSDTAGALPHGPRWLTWAGRHSLFLYMAHVPVLVGLVALAKVLL